MMAELYSNQIDFKAPDGKKANFVASQQNDLLYQLKQPLLHLGEVAEQAARSEAAFQDNVLINQLETIQDQFHKELNEASNETADYNSIGANAVVAYNNALNNVNDATRQRFMNRNPNAQLRFQMGVRADVLKKRLDQIAIQTENRLPEWSSQIVVAPESAQSQMLLEKELAIRNLGLPVEKTEALINSLKSDVARANITKLIATERFSEAEQMLTNAAPTIGATERSQFYQRLQNAMREQAYRTAQEKKDLLEAQEKGEDTFTKSIMLAHQELLNADRIDDAKKFREQFLRGEDIVIPAAKEGEKPTVLKTSSVAADVRDKLVGNMESSANRMLNYSDYDVSKNADFNRLELGLGVPKDPNKPVSKDNPLVFGVSAMTEGGSFKPGVVITPDAVALARSLRNSKEWWSKAGRAERVFINNVIGNVESELVASITMNPEANAKVIEKNLVLPNAEVGKLNPLISLGNIVDLYSDPNIASIGASAADTKQDENAVFLKPQTTITGQEWYATDALVQNMYDKLFPGEWRPQKGSVPDGLARLTAIVSSPNLNLSSAQPLNKIGMGNVSPAVVMDRFYTKTIPEIKASGIYDDMETLPQSGVFGLMKLFDSEIYQPVMGKSIMSPKTKEEQEQYDALFSLASVAYAGAMTTNQTPVDESLLSEKQREPFQAELGQGKENIEVVYGKDTYLQEKGNITEKRRKGQI